MPSDRGCTANTGFSAMCSIETCICDLLVLRPQVSHMLHPCFVTYDSALTYVIIAVGMHTCWAAVVWKCCACGRQPRHTSVSRLSVAA